MVTITGKKVYFRRMKLRSDVEMRKDDGSLVATASLGGMGVEVASITDAGEGEQPGSESAR